MVDLVIKVSTNDDPPDRYLTAKSVVREEYRKMLGREPEEEVGPLLARRDEAVEKTAELGGTRFARYARGPLHAGDVGILELSEKPDIRIDEMLRKVREAHCLG